VAQGKANIALYCMLLLAAGSFAMWATEDLAAAETTTL